MKKSKERSKERVNKRERKRRGGGREVDIFIIVNDREWEIMAEIMIQNRKNYDEQKRFKWNIQ